MACAPSFVEELSTASFVDSRLGVIERSLRQAHLLIVWLSFLLADTLKMTLSTFGSKCFHLGDKLRCGNVSKSHGTHVAIDPTTTVK